MRRFAKFIGIMCTITVIVLSLGWAVGAVTIKIDLSHLNDFVKSSAGPAKKNTGRETAPVTTLDEAECAFANMDRKLWSYIVKKDRDSMGAMFSGLKVSDREYMLDLFDSFRKDAPSLTKSYTHIIAEADGCYYGEAIHYLATRQGNQSHESDRYYRYAIKKTNGSWKCVSVDADTESALADNLYSRFPEGFQEAYHANRNAFVFGNMYWMDDRGVYENAVASNCIYAWQNKDGSVDVGVSIANGESVIHKVTKCTVTLKDEKLGQVLKMTQSLNLHVLPGTREIYIMHINASKVRKGTWTTMSCSTDITY